MGRGRILGSTAVTLLWLASCQLVPEKSPTSPSEATPVPLAIPVIGMPTPAPPAPTAAPTPAPVPTPDPPEPPASTSCSLPPSNPSSPVCTDDSPSLFAAVDKALTAVTQKHPEYFDLDDKKCANCYYVKNVDGYIDAVLNELSRQGLCAVGDPEEIGVKKTNAYNEQYDILLASRHMRRGLGSYRGVCRPALF